MRPVANVSRIAQARPDSVEVRGRDLTGDLMGRLTFTEYFHLLLTGDEPTDDQRFFLDLLLVSIAEHGLMPTNVAARMTLAADPGSLQGAVAAGILGAGPVVLGTAEECARLLQREGEPAAIAGRDPRRGREGARFGHPVHRPLDPRAERILELADERGVGGPHVARARAFRERARAADDERRDADRRRDARPRLPGSTVKAVPILARTAGLLAHLAEEREHPLGFAMAAAAEDAVEYRAPE